MKKVKQLEFGATTEESNNNGKLFILMKLTRKLPRD